MKKEEKKIQHMLQIISSDPRAFGVVLAHRYLFHSITKKEMHLR